MTEQTQEAAAKRFRELHHGDILVLPCAWDCASAAVFEDAGFSAIGTTSSGLAHAHGRPDGEQIRIDALIAAVERFVDVVSIPVSVDFEAGYGATVDEVLGNVEAVVAAGAVGINLEDGSGPRADPFVDIADQQALIESIRTRTDEIGIPIVINARTDVYLKGDGDPAERFERAVDRTRAYLQAGADCVFPIGITERESIREFVAAVDGPLNVMAKNPDVPPIDELAELGVARLSVGGGPMNATVALVQQIADELRSDGTYTYLDDAVPRSMLQERFG